MRSGDVSSEYPSGSVVFIINISSLGIVIKVASGSENVYRGANAILPLIEFGSCRFGIECIGDTHHLLGAVVQVVGASRKVNTERNKVGPIAPVDGREITTDHSSVTDD